MKGGKDNARNGPLKTQTTDATVGRVWTLVRSHRSVQAKELNKNKATRRVLIEDPGVRQKMRNYVAIFWLRSKLQKWAAYFIHQPQHLIISEYFRNWENALKDQRFANIQRQWHHCLTTYIASQEEYFQGDRKPILQRWAERPWARRWLCKPASHPHTF